ncbi:transposase InsO family protein [Bradyrhizobium sp. USDA 4524]|nr:transposase InsO family protein [Bradyrhizobium sp. USDA 4538]MCP1905739.1 transposase InsO family protein [Bradyrhizobium sp. USDA 4537]MCP1988605.1 transposase InsO family protein [Bradyrhizobium sp. USDA 4539]
MFELDGAQELEKAFSAARQQAASAMMALSDPMAANKRQGRARREWAYARAYDTSDQRAQDLPIWLHHYNWHRPHGSLQAKPPISRLAIPRTTC